MLTLDYSYLSQWMLAHGGIPTEDSYGPYLGQDGYCRADKATVGLKIKVGFFVSGRQYPHKRHIYFVKLATRGLGTLQMT